ncbi:solute carrier family 9, subfamily A [Sesbania bispinosa]|nr:solute carrier family 9, subfamily A [Sesbania bispinosa]
MEESEKSSEENQNQNQELFKTVMGMALRRRVVSYKDAILGVNGGKQSEAGSDYEGSYYANSSEDDSSKDYKSEQEAVEPTTDPFCTEEHISHQEYKKA